MHHEGEESPRRGADFAYETRRLLAPYFRRRRFQREAFLWHQGDRSGMLVSLVRGHAKAVSHLPVGREVTIYLFGPGDVFGFLPFMDGEAYPLSTVAVEDVEADVLTRDELLDIVRESPEVALTLLALLGRRLREAMDRVARMSGVGALPRVAAALSSLLPEQAGAGVGPCLIEIPVAGHEYAAALGITPESLSRAISKLVEEGIVHRLANRKIQVLDTDKLRRHARDAPGGADRVPC